MWSSGLLPVVVFPATSGGQTTFRAKQNSTEEKRTEVDWKSGRGQRNGCGQSSQLAPADYRAKIIDAPLLPLLRARRVAAPPLLSSAFQCFFTSSNGSKWSPAAASGPHPKGQVRAFWPRPLGVGPTNWPEVRASSSLRALFAHRSETAGEC